ncbi:MAG: glycerophosphoryl diester phosphodiesterase membrane domain-containing protein [Tannerellaceae bacterium]|jgi:hypothetical protein|nr:glycerophosphoryl diester phosphodiesterase membrane domain-containing protein [Tannerellaceae bacterium]
MKQTFSISEVVGASWVYLKQQIWVLVGLFIGYTIITFLIGSFFPQTSMTMMVIANLITGIIGIFFMLGYYKNLFQTIDGLEPQFSAYGQQAPKFLTAFIAGLIVSIAISIGMLLLIVPGIYLALRLQFFTCFIVEENAGIMDSLKRSWALTEGHAMKLFILALVWLGLIILGVLLLVIGLFVTMPLIYMTYCNAFRLLNSPVAIADDDEMLPDVAVE